MALSKEDFTFINSQLLNLSQFTTVDLFRHAIVFDQGGMKQFEIRLGSPPFPEDPPDGKPEHVRSAIEKLYPQEREAIEALYILISEHPLNEFFPIPNGFQPIALELRPSLTTAMHEKRVLAYQNEHLSAIGERR